MINSNSFAAASYATSNQSVPTIEKNLDEKALKERTDAFEAIIIKMMLDNAMKDEKNLFTAQKDPGDKIFKSMYRDELSKASAGGFGFSEMLFNHLKEQ